MLGVIAQLFLSREPFFFNMVNANQTTLKYFPLELRPFSHLFWYRLGEVKT